MRTEVRTGSREWIPAGLGILWLAVFPLACDCTYAHLTLAKWAAMGVGAALTLVGLVALVIRTDRLLLRGTSRLLMGLLLAWLTLSSLVTALFGGEEAGGLARVLAGARHEGLVAWLGYGLIFLALSQGEGRPAIVAAAAAGSLALQCVLVAVQYAGVNPLGFYPAGYDVFRNYELQGTIGNIDMMAGYLAVAVPFTVIPWVVSGGRARLPCMAGGLLGILLGLMTGVQAWLAALAVLLCGIAYLALTRPETRPRAFALAACLGLCLLARGCVRLPWLGECAGSAAFALPSARTAALSLGLILSGSGLALWSRRRPLRAVRRRAALWILAVIIAAAVLAAALLPVPETAGGLWEIHETLNLRPRASFGSERLGIWRAALGLIAERPVFGAGFGNFEAAAGEWMRLNGLTLRQTFDSPHSLYLSLAADAGVPALLLLLALAASLLRDCARGNRPALALCLLCWLVQGCFTFSVCITSPVAWAAFGMIAAPAAADPRRLP